MKHKEGHFHCIRNAKIYWQSWLPKTEPRAILVIIHGYNDHSGRFMNIINYFVPKGFAIYGLDQIGQGKSEGKRVYVQKFEDYTITLQFFLRMVRNMQPGKPIFLVGYSMGGLVTSIYILDNQKELAGAILIGPLVKVPEHVTSFTIFIGKILSAFFPKVGLLATKDEAISKDQAVVDTYKLDPLTYHGKMTARLAAELLKAMIRLSKEGSKITLPVLILQGAADRLGDPEGAQMLFYHIQSEDKQIKLYQGLYHEIFNEPEREMVFADMGEWLNRQIGRN
jgi:acylglycerol lipase